jgi:hypothetical protein
MTLSHFSMDYPIKPTSYWKPWLLLEKLGFGPGLFNQSGDSIPIIFAAHVYRPSKHSDNDEMKGVTRGDIDSTTG